MHDTALLRSFTIKVKLNRKREKERKKKKIESASTNRTLCVFNSIEDTFNAFYSAIEGLDITQHVKFIQYLLITNCRKERCSIIK